jgi:hypothetical protein
MGWVSFYVTSDYGQNWTMLDLKELINGTAVYPFTPDAVGEYVFWAKYDGYYYGDEHYLPSNSGTPQSSFLDVTVHQPVPAQITIVKNTLGYTGSFTFQTTGGNGLPEIINIDANQPTDFDGKEGYTGSSITFSVTPDVSYSIAENVPSGNDWRLYGSAVLPGPVVPDRNTVSVTPSEGQSITIEFNNYKTGGPVWAVPEWSAVTLLGAGLIILSMSIIRKQWVNRKKQST